MDPKIKKILVLKLPIFLCLLNIVPKPPSNQTKEVPNGPPPQVSGEAGSSPKPNSPPATQESEDLEIQRRRELLMKGMLKGGKKKSTGKSDKASPARYFKFNYLLLGKSAIRVLTPCVR